MKKLVLGVTITVCKLRKMLLVSDCMFFAVSYTFSTPQFSHNLSGMLKNFTPLTYTPF